MGYSKLYPSNHYFLKPIVHTMLSNEREGLPGG
jgi:hypothetical protein